MRKFGIPSLLVLFFSFLLLAACKKKDPNTTLEISGMVVNPLLNTPIQGVAVELSVQEVSGGIWSSGYRNIGDAATNSAGEYDFTFEKSNAVEYKLQYEKEGYFSTEVVVDPEAVTADNPFYSTENMYAQSWLHVRYQNVNPQDSLDELRFRQISGINDCGTCCGGAELFFYGETIDTTTVCLLYGGQRAVFNYWVTKNGNIYAYVDSVYCAPFDTTYFTVFY